MTGRSRCIQERGIFSRWEGTSLSGVKTILLTLSLGLMGIILTLNLWTRTRKRFLFLALMLDPTNHLCKNTKLLKFTWLPLLREAPEPRLNRHRSMDLTPISMESRGAFWEMRKPAPKMLNFMHLDLTDYITLHLLWMHLYFCRLEISSMETLNLWTGLLFIKTLIRISLLRPLNKTFLGSIQKLIQELLFRSNFVYKLITIFRKISFSIFKMVMKLIFL